MHTCFLRSRRSNTLACLALVFLLGTFALAERLSAQEETPTSTPVPATPNATAADTNNGSTLFPGGGTPAPELEENRAGGRGGGRNGGGGGRRGLGHGQSGRATDILSARAASDPLTVRVAFRKAKTEAFLLHPELNDLQQQAADAATETEKKAYLRSYYTLLYSTVKKVDRSPAMASHVEVLSSIAQQRYDPKRRTISGDEDLVRGRGGRGRRR